MGGVCELSGGPKLTSLASSCGAEAAAMPSPPSRTRKNKLENQTLLELK